jgi:hypothetical protein
MGIFAKISTMEIFYNKKNGVKTLKSVPSAFTMLTVVICKHP